MIVLRFGVSREMNEVAHAWGVLAEARAASLAIRQMPEPYPALNAQQANVRDRMLRRLNEPGCRRSNRELANDIGAAEATIARALTELRRQGLVLSWSAGRAMVNQLTEAGVLAANALKPQPPPPVVHEEGIRMLAANSISDVDSVSRKFEDRKRELLRRDLREKERVAALVPT